MIGARYRVDELDSEFRERDVLGPIQTWWLSDWPQASLPRNTSFLRGSTAKIQPLGNSERLKCDQFVTNDGHTPFIKSRD